MRPILHVKILERVVYALLCGVWLASFLPPMAQLGLLNGAKTFDAPIAVIAVGLVFGWWWMRGLCALIAAFGYVAYFWRLPPHATFLQNLKAMPNILVHQMGSLIRQGTFVDPLQTFLFVWAAALVFWLIAYACHRTKLWLFYNILAIGVLAAIDGNTDVHPNGSIVVVIIVCMLVLGFNQLSRILFFAPPDTRPVLRFATPLVLLIAVTISVACALPKQVAAWPNPFGPGTEGGSGKGIQSIGYQLDDSRLGGSFVANDEEVLDVYSPNPTYLRGQTLTVYTGKGWESAPLTDSQMAVQTIGKPFQNVEGSTFENMPAKTITQTIQVKASNIDTTELLGGYAVNKVDSLPQSYRQQFSVDTVQDNIHGPKLTAGDLYQVQTQELRSPYDVLMNDTKPFSSVEGSIPSDVRQDLQLPGDLPMEVHKLAQSIVAENEGTSEYQMVSAIETYLQTNYTYQTYDIPVPGKNQDYVDQFLFSSKRGYCNNFSSSLAVMLRTLGIPTRWVTGYATGTQDYTYSNKINNKYIVTNDDAHSWVEVYFPTYGWIPFDPTPNFDIPFAASNLSSSSTAATGQTTPTPPAPKTPKAPPTQPQTQSSTSGYDSFSWGQLVSRMLYVIAGIVILGVIALILFNRRLTLSRLEKQWEAQPQQALDRVYRMLFRLLKKRHALTEATTLRELWPFAAEVGIGHAEYRTWVNTAERVLYGGESFSPEVANTMRGTSMRWLRLLYQRNRG